MPRGSGNGISFDLPGFDIQEVIDLGYKQIVQADSTSTSARCPECGAASRRVHSYYTRSPCDLPYAGRVVCLKLRVKRFRCPNQQCQRATFAERLPGLAPVHAQRTERLTVSLRQVAFELGGEAGARLSRRLSMPHSPDTLLRIIRQTSLEAIYPARVVGVDDWAFRRGRVYGTLLVDLERHSLLDLLPDPDAQTLAGWLRAHPGIEIISRDRAGVYAEGARLGAPQAVQVVDRWHLFKNLSEALAACYDRHARQLRQIKVEPDTAQLEQTVVTQQAFPLPDRPVRKRPVTPQQQAREQRRAYWLGKFQEVHALLSLGLSQRAIMSQTGLSQLTVRKYCRLPELPQKASPKPGPRLIDPFRPYMEERLLVDATVSSRALWREIRARGFRGGFTTAYEGIVRLRQDLNVPLPTHGMRTVPVPRAVPLTARSLAALVLCQPGSLSAAKQQLISRANHLHPEIRKVTQLALDFAAMLRTHDAERLDRWVQEAVDSNVPSLAGFASGLRSDYEAIQAALRLPWSNGQVEGQVNRLKFIKRQMYGRAKFDLLRLRVLYH